MRRLSCILLLSVPALAQGDVETFDGGGNAGAWSFFANDQILASGGHPGAFLDTDNLNTFAPQPSTTDPGSVFCGDWRGRGVTSFGIDVVVHSTQFAYLREASLLLTNGSKEVFTLGTEFIPDPGAWKSFDYEIPAQSGTLPPGWFVRNSTGTDDADWNAVITNVTRVTLFYGHPENFFIFDLWETGIDNPRIFEGGIGTNYCSTNPNSTGQPGVISARGSDVVADDLLWLKAGDLPLGQPGYFIASETQGFVAMPGGSQGNLCLGGNIARFVDDVMTTGPSGSLQLLVDLDDIPLLGAVQPGESWNFQSWFRDANPGPTSNFSDGVTVQFQ